MIKSVTFISVAVTTFILVLLAGVVYAYQGFMTPTPSPIAPPALNLQTVGLSINAQSPTNTTDISPQDAASMAAKFSNRTDLYSVELAEFNGSQSYKVTFSSGDVLYVSLNGQLVGSASPPLQSQSIVVSPTTTPKPLIIYQGPIKKRPTAGHGTGSSGSSSSGGGGGGHEGDD